MKYQDLADLPEDDRIDRIALAAMAGQTVAVVTDAEPADKVDRYMQKILNRFPQLEIVGGPVQGPTPGAVTFKVRQKR